MTASPKVHIMVVIELVTSFGVCTCTHVHTPHTYVFLYWSIGVNWVEVVVAIYVGEWGADIALY